MENKASVAVVGAGIVGSMITKFLRADGFNVLLFDNREKYAASQCSAGVWRDSWVADEHKDKCEITKEVVEQLLPGKIQTMTFQEEGKGEVTMYKLDVEDILEEPNRIADIKKINKLNQLITDTDVRSQAFDFIVVSAGVWTNDLLMASEIIPISHIDRQFGASLFTGHKKKNNFVKTWAPYKQMVGFNRPGGYYFGDGFTVKNPPLRHPEEDVRVVNSLKRLHDHYDQCKLDQVDISEFKGFRPYLQNKNDSLVNSYRGGKIVTAVGTAKSATILCGWIAAEVACRLNECIKIQNKKINFVVSKTF